MLVVVQLGAEVDLGSAGHEEELRRLAAASPPEATVRRMEAIMTCRERLELNVAPLLAVEEMTLALARLEEPSSWCLLPRRRAAAAQKHPDHGDPQDRGQRNGGWRVQ